MIDDYTFLTQAGFLKGLGALFGGLIGGFRFSTALTILFFSIRNPYGIAGGLIIIAAMLIGMPAKIYFMDHISSTVLAIFIFSMVIKNFGLIFMGVGFILRHTLWDRIAVILGETLTLRKVFFRHGRYEVCHNYRSSPMPGVWS